MIKKSLIERILDKETQEFKERILEAFDLESKELDDYFGPLDDCCSIRPLDMVDYDRTVQECYLECKILDGDEVFVQGLNIIGYLGKDIEPKLMYVPSEGGNHGR